MVNFNEPNTSQYKLLDFKLVTKEIVAFILLGLYYSKYSGKHTGMSILINITINVFWMVYYLVSC